MFKQLKAAKFDPNKGMKLVLFRQESGHIATAFYWEGSRIDIYRSDDKKLYITIQVGDSYHRYTRVDSGQTDDWYLRSAQQILSDIGQRPWNYEQRGNEIVWVGS